VRAVEYWKKSYENEIKNAGKIDSLNEIKEDSNEQMNSPLLSGIFQVP